MHTDRFQKLAVLWLAVWFGIIVPGHKRGLVLLPGGESRQPAMSDARATDAEPCPLASIMARNGSCCPASKAPAEDAPGLPVTHCAICYLTGVLDVPPAPDFAPQPLELVLLLAWPAPDEVESIEPLQTCLGRAPPLA